MEETPFPGHARRLAALGQRFRFEVTVTTGTDDLDATSCPDVTVTVNAGDHLGWVAASWAVDPHTNRFRRYDMHGVVVDADNGQARSIAPSTMTALYGQVHSFNARQRPYALSALAHSTR